MKKLLIFLFTVILICGLFAQENHEKEIITVLDFKTSNITQDEMYVFIDYIASHIVETHIFRVIDRTQREFQLREIEFSFSGVADEEQQLNIGRVLSADKIIVGSLGKVGNRYILNIKLLDVETGEQTLSASEKYSSIDDLIDDSKRLTLYLLKDELAKHEEPEEEEVVADTDTEEEDTQPVDDRALTDISDNANVRAEKITKETGFVRNGGFEAGGGFVSGNFPLAFGTAGYSYSFSKMFGLGVWAGAGMSNGSMSPLIGVKALVGNPENLAVSVNAGLYPGLGVYFRSWYLNLILANIVSFDHTTGIEVGFRL